MVPEPVYQTERVTVYQGDCLEIMPLLGPVDLIVADPPYMFGMASTMHEGKAGSWADMMNAARWYADMLKRMRERVERNQGAALVFNSWRSFPVLARAAYEAKWGIESLMVWDKEWIGPGGPAGLRPSYELVALFRHPEFKITDRGLPDIWRSKWCGQKPTGHPAEKPVDLVLRLITKSGVPSAGVVLDPFGGSGTTAVAALRAGCSALLIEREPKYIEIIKRRLKQEEAQGRLF